MNTDGTPWYQRTLRWGQTNLTEIDPTRYDFAFWRAHWRRTRVQGVIVNAGGIVAYYPSAHPLHHRAIGLGDRDLYGDVVRDAREEGLTVVARMDSNRATEEFYRAHPDWFTHDIHGEPFMAGERYIACVNSDYYVEYLPSIFREIMDRSHPDGFADNSWTGLGSTQICFCENCARAFHAATGSDLPKVVDYDDRPTATGCAGTSDSAPRCGGATPRSPRRQEDRTACGSACSAAIRRRWSDASSTCVRSPARRRSCSSTTSAATTATGSRTTLRSARASTVSSAGTGCCRRAWRCTAQATATSAPPACRQPRC